MAMTDASIPLQVRPPQFASPAEAIDQQLSLRNAVQTGQLQQGQQQLQQQQIQQGQMELDSEKAMQQAYLDSGGDMEKFQQMAAQRGVLPKHIMAVNQHMLQQREALGKIHETDLKVQQGHAEQIGSAAQSLLGMSPDDRVKNWPQIRSQLITQGHAKDSELPQDLPTGPDGDNWLRLHSAMATTAKDQLAAESKRREVAALEMRANAQKKQADTGEQERLARLPGLQADARQKQREDYSKRLENATTQEQYDAVRNSMPHDLATELPDKFDPKTTPDVISTWGLTPGQKSTAEHQGVLEDNAQARLNLERQRLQRENAQTKNSSAVDRRQAQSSISKLMTGEAKLNRFRGQLGTALSSLDENGIPKIYVDRLGNSKPMSRVADDDETKRALAEEMKQTYQNASDELKSTIAEKNNHYQFLGVAPRVSTDQAHAAVDAGDKKLFDTIAAKKNPPAQGAATPPAAPTQKPVAVPAKPQQQTQSQAPPVSLLKENTHTTLKNPATGKTEVWTLQNGKAVKI